jgi:L-rhamnose mutarotase
MKTYMIYMAKDRTGQLVVFDIYYSYRHARMGEMLRQYSSDLWWDVCRVYQPHKLDAFLSMCRTD